MKNKISFLVTLTIAMGANCAIASECVDNDCDIDSIIIQENIDIDEMSEPIRYEINLVETAPQEQTCCEHDYNCPFDSADECAIWYKKPVHVAAMYARAPHINPVLVDDMLYEIYSDYNVSANNPAMGPLLERYKMLMNASQKCCTTGIVYKMHSAKIDDVAVYNFLKDDANHFAVGERCMVMGNDDISHEYSNGVTGQMVADVRNACLCKNRQWFESLLQPFVDIYERAPQFENRAFTYTYTDGLQREISVSVNGDVQTTLGLLSACPD